MRSRRNSSVIGLAVVTALSLSACAGSSGEPSAATPPDAVTVVPAEGKTEPVRGGSVTVAEREQFTSFNSDSETGLGSSTNGTVSYLTHSGFYYVDDQLEVIRNEEFGTYEVTSEDPFTVAYTVNEDVTWSDGEPIDAGDLLLSWAVQSGHFDDKNPETHTGTTYFAYAGDTGTSHTSLPEISDNGRTIVLEYPQPFADYETAFDVLDTPAHVVAAGAGLADEDALVDLIQTAPDGDPENLEDRPELWAVASYWNTAFDTTSLPDDPALYLSSGPYIVQSMDMDWEQSMTLVRNEAYTWGPEPALDEITIRHIEDSYAQIRALENDEVDIVQPFASRDALASLEAIDDIQIFAGRELTFDNIELNYSGVFEDENIRRAFMHTIPRTAIIEAVVGPLDPEAKPRDSYIFGADAAGYDAAVTVNGSEEFAEPDIEEAVRLLDGATPEVRIMYNADNPNRVDAHTLIAESAGQAGFTVVDGGLPSDEWRVATGDGSYDATITGWLMQGVGVGGVPQLYGCDSVYNYHGFCDEKAQAAMDELATTIDPDEQQELQTIVDTRLFETGYGLPLFQSIGIFAADEQVKNLTFNQGSTGVWWNFWEWSVS